MTLAVIATAIYLTTALPLAVLTGCCIHRGHQTTHPNTQDGDPR